jgi:hypothetical protein
MTDINSSRGAIVTVLCALGVIIAIILVPTFSSMAFFCKNWARIDSLRQQAYYNAGSGVEYARFIIEHGTVYGSDYDPLDRTGEITGRSAWPAWPIVSQEGSSQCFDGRSDLGSVEVSITSAVTPKVGYNVSSTGTLGAIRATIGGVNIAGTKVEEWK